MSTKKGSIKDAIAQGETELTPDQARAKEITERLQNPTAPVLHFGKRKSRQGTEMHFQIEYQGEKFGRILVFKSRHDLQAAAALVEAVIRGLFAKEYEADLKYLEDTREEMQQILERMGQAEQNQTNTPEVKE